MTNGEERFGGEGRRTPRRPKSRRCALEVDYAVGSLFDVTLGFRVIGGERDGHEFFEVFGRRPGGDPYRRVVLTEEVAAGTKLHGVVKACLAGTNWEGAFDAEGEPLVLDGEVLKALPGRRIEAKVERSVYGWEYIRHRTARPLPGPEQAGPVGADAEREGFVGAVLADLSDLDVAEGSAG